jgi:hypothetical protein
MKKVEIYGKMRKQHPVRSTTDGILMLTKEAMEMVDLFYSYSAVNS